MKLVDIVTSRALNDGKIDEQEFGMLQTLYSKSLNELMGVDHKMEAENRNQEEMNDIKSTLKQQELCNLVMFSLCFFCMLLPKIMPYNLKWTGSKIFTTNLITSGKDGKPSRSWRT